MSEKEVTEIKTTLSLIGTEKQNLIQHLQIQENNFVAILQKFIKIMEEKCAKLEIENVKLKAAVTRSDNDSPSV